MGTVSLLGGAGKALASAAVSAATSVGDYVLTGAGEGAGHRSAKPRAAAGKQSKNRRAAPLLRRAGKGGKVGLRRRSRKYSTWQSAALQPRDLKRDLTQDLRREWRPTVARSWADAKPRRPADAKRRDFI